MTPVGHACLSFALGHRASRPTALAIMAGGLAPDIDLLLLPFGSFNDIHRTATHSLAFVAIVSVICMLVARRRRMAVLAGAGVGGLMHLWVDAILDANPTNGIGVAWFWPLSDAVVSPFNLALTTCPGWDDPGAAAFCNLGGLIWEYPFYVLALWIAWRRYRAARTPSSMRVEIGRS